MGRASWITHVDPKYNHKCPYKQEVEGYLNKQREGHSMNNEIEIEVMWLQAKEYQQPADVGKGIFSIINGFSTKVLEEV